MSTPTAAAASVSPLVSVTPLLVQLDSLVRGVQDDRARMHALEQELVREKSVSAALRHDMYNLHLEVLELRRVRAAPAAPPAAASRTDTTNPTQGEVTLDAIVMDKAIKTSVVMYQCHACGLMYSNPQSYRQHMNRKHAK